MGARIKSEKSKEYLPKDEMVLILQIKPDSSSMEKCLGDLILNKYRALLLKLPNGALIVKYDPWEKTFCTEIADKNGKMISGSMIKNVFNGDFKVRGTVTIMPVEQNDSLLSMRTFLKDACSKFLGHPTNTEVEVMAFKNSNRFRERIDFDDYIESHLNFRRGLRIWECIRRNDEYKAAYKANPWGKPSQSVFRKWNLIILIDPRIKATELEREESKIFRRKFSLKDILSYGKRPKELFTTFDYLGEIRDSILLNRFFACRYDKIKKKAVMKIMNSNGKNTKVVYGRDNILKHVSNSLRITIDLTYNTTEIFKRLELVIGMFKEMLNEVGIAEQVKEFDEVHFKKSLEEYDFKMKNNCSHEKVAEYFGCSVDTCKRDFAYAKSLIEGKEFMNIR